jgi:hypothetical protein
MFGGTTIWSPIFSQPTNSEINQFPLLHYSGFADANVSDFDTAVGSFERVTGFLKIF